MPGIVRSVVHSSAQQFSAKTKYNLSVWEYRTHLSHLCAETWMAFCFGSRYKLCKCVQWFVDIKVKLQASHWKCVCLLPVRRPWVRFVFFFLVVLKLSSFVLLRWSETAATWKFCFTLLCCVVIYTEAFSSNIKIETTKKSLKMTW